VHEIILYFKTIAKYNEGKMRKLLIISTFYFEILQLHINNREKE